METPASTSAVSPTVDQARKEDEHVRAESVTFDSPKGTGMVRGYLAHPASQTKALPGVLVVHDKGGLTPHIEDVARRLAVAGYVAFAPDARVAKTNPAKMREDFLAAAAFVAPRSDCDGHVVALGFGQGGGVVNTLVTRLATLSAAVAFEGAAPNLAAVAHIKTPLQLHYAGKDAHLNANLPAFEAALKANHVTYEIHRYPGTQSGFYDETSPHFDKDAAALAWQRTLEFFQKHLGEGAGSSASKP